jgi:peptidoglycan/LPS O-acetylase OafA/YrhL
LTTKKTLDRRIPSLDGLRAVSIALVIASHFNTVPIPGLRHLEYGNFGVRVFFVISGFLITTLLLQERADTGSISLRYFYARRFARIMPAYWGYLAVIALLIPAGAVAAEYRDFAPAFFYLTNYAKVGVALAATWSLSVEEQFYLIWPSVLRLTGMRRAILVCVAALIVAPAFRVLSDLGLWPTNPREAFECVCDALASGCLLAILRRPLWEFAAYRRFVSSPYALLTLLVVLAGLAVNRSTLMLDAVGITALNVSIAIAIDNLMRRPSSVVGKALNSTPLVWTGTLSYSLYLWQQPFTDSPLPFLVKISGTLGCACASYYWLERPLRRSVNAHCRSRLRRTSGE